VVRAEMAAVNTKHEGFAARGVVVPTVRSAAVLWPSFPVAAAARFS